MATGLIDDEREDQAAKDPELTTSPETRADELEEMYKAKGGEEIGTPEERRERFRKARAAQDKAKALKAQETAMTAKEATDKSFAPKQETKAKATGGGLLRRRRGLIFGGGGAILFGGGIGVAIFMFLQAHIATSMMNGVERFFMKRVHHSIQKRTTLYYKAMINRAFGVDEGEVFVKESDPFYKKALRSLDKNDRFKTQLRKEVETQLKSDGISFKIDDVGINKKATITHPDGSKEEIKFNEPNAKTRIYNIAAESLDKGASAELSKWQRVKAAFHRFRAKRLITKLTGTKWHFIDKITGPYQKVKATVREHIISAVLHNKYVDKMFQIAYKMIVGDDLPDGELANKTEGQFTDLAKKVVVKITPDIAKQVIEEAFTKLNEIGFLVKIAEISCRLNQFFDKGGISETVKNAIGGVYMGKYAEWSSVASQERDGNTNSNTAAAYNEFLTSSDGKQGIANTNNYTRVNNPDKAPAYKESYDCKSAREMCVTMQPDHALEKNTLTKGLAVVDDVGKTLYSPEQQDGILKIIGTAGEYSGLTPGNPLVDKACQVFLAATSTVGGFLGDIVGGILGVLRKADPTGSLDFLEHVGQSVVKWGFGVATEAVTHFIGIDDLRGPVLYNAISAGGELTADAIMGPEELNAPHITPQQLTEVNHAADIEIAQEHSKQSLWDQLANLDDPDSLSNRMILSAPPTPQIALGHLGQYMASIMRPDAWMKALSWANNFTPPVRADANSPYVSPFGKTTFYGFTEQQLDQPLGADGMDKIDRSAGCSMLAGLAASAEPGETVDYPDECKQDDNSVGGSGVSTPSAGIVSGNSQELAKQLLANPNVKYGLPGSREAIQAAANGQPSPTTCGNAGSPSAPLNNTVLGILVALANRYPITINATTNACHTGGSYHYTGHAADLSDAEMSNPALIQDLYHLLPQGSGVGQPGCIAAPPSGISQFADPCNHLHFQVPR